MQGVQSLQKHNNKVEDHILRFNCLKNLKKRLKYPTKSRLYDKFVIIITIVIKKLVFRIFLFQAE